MVANGTRKLLLLGMFICCFPGIGNDSAEDPPTFQVNGILGSSIWLPVNLTSAKPVHKINWYYCRKTSKETNAIAEFSAGELKRPNATDRFGKRLEMANGTMLRIKALEMEDSGVYEADVRFNTSETRSHYISLTVYERVPQPEISHQPVSDTPEGCVTILQCHVPEKGGFNVSWKMGDPPRALEDGSVRFQRSDNGTKLHVFGQLSASECNITCSVSNPADQKNVSISLCKVCPDKGKHTWWFFRCFLMDFQNLHSPLDCIGVAILIFGVICIGILMYVYHRKRIPSVCNALHFRPQKGSPPDLQYIAIQQKTAPPEVGHPVGQVREHFPNSHDERTQT